MLKTISSLNPKEKYKSIGQSMAKEIVKGIKDFSARGKLKAVATGLGTGRVSLINLAKKISKTQGALAADKFIRAAQAELNQGVDPDIQKRFLKANMQRDESGLRSPERKVSFAGGSLGAKTTGLARTKGTMENIGLKRGQVGFAGNFKIRPSGDQTPKAPLGGTRPIGL